MKIMDFMYVLEPVITEDCIKVKEIIALAGFALRIIQIVAPILLIIWGSIDLIKAIIAGKEDEVKKGQQILIKRLIAALILFLIPFIVSIVLGVIGSKSWRDCWNEYKTAPIIQVEDLDVGDANNEEEGK